MTTPMKPTFDRENDLWFLREKLGNGQTIFMSFERTDSSMDTDYYNVALCVVSKRKQIDSAFDSAAMTGRNPLQTIALAREMFAALEEWVTELYSQSCHVVVYCTWLDRRRREVYHRFLSRRGYRYGMLFGRKVIYKRFAKGWI